MSNKIMCSTVNGEVVELPGGAMDFIKTIADNWDKISALIPILISLIKMFAKNDTPVVN